MKIVVPTTGRKMADEGSSLLNRPAATFFFFFFLVFSAHTGWVIEDGPDSCSVGRTAIFSGPIFQV